MSYAWDVFDVCDREIVLDAKQHPKGFRFPSPKRRNEEKVWRKVVEFNPESEFHLDLSFYKLKNRIIERTQYFCEIHIYNTKIHVLQTILE